MKKSLLSAIIIFGGLSVLLVGCKTKINTQAINSLTSLSQITPTEIKTKTVVVADSVVLDGKSGKAVIDIDFPEAGNFFAINNIREWILEQLGGTFEGAPDNASAMINHYKQSFITDFRENIIPDMPKIEDMQCYKDIKIKRLCETDRYITYLYTQEGYAGGAHGWYLLQGQTFRKSDGRRINYDIFRAEMKDELAQLIQDNIYTQYFDSDKEQIEGGLTLENSDYFPLPVSAPIFREDGVEFIYQQYEISCYAAGLPSCVISYDLLEPFFTQSGRWLINAGQVAEN